MSTHLVIAFTSQRLFSICFPFKKNIIETRSKLVVIGLILFACIFYNYALWGYNSEYLELESVTLDDSMRRCKARKGYENLVDELDLADSVLTFIFPFLSISIMNVIIVRKLKESKNDFILCSNNNHSNIQKSKKSILYMPHNKKSNKTSQIIDYDNKLSLSMSVNELHSRIENEKSENNIHSTLRLKHLTNNSPETSKKFSCLNIFGHHSKKKIETSVIDTRDSFTSGFVSYKVTKMLIFVSTVFLILNLPYHSFKFYVYIRIRRTQFSNYTSAEACIIDFLQQLFYASFACNFFLYSISGRAFRNEFKNFVLNICKKKF